MRLVRNAIISVFILIVSLASTVAAQDLDNKGKEFIFSMMPNYSGSVVTLELHLTSDVATTVTVEYPMDVPTFIETVSLTPGQVSIVSLTPDVDYQNLQQDTVAQEAVRVSGPEEFVSYLINRRQYSSDAALALPVDSFNTDYVLSGYTATLGGGQFALYAPYDNTEVTITPAVDITGHNAGQPYTVTLNRGDVYFNRVRNGRGAQGDITGTTIEATRPIGAINGNLCANIPFGVPYCDNVFSVARPVQTWSKSAYLSPLANRVGGSVYVVVASEDNTVVTLDGGSLGTINRGQSINTGILAGNHVLEADKPIYVSQFMTGQNAASAVSGDPAMAAVTPPDQFLPDYTFSTVSGGQFAEHHMSIIADLDDVQNGTILLDGLPISATLFTQIGSTDYASAIVELTEGPHTTTSNGVHGITVAGYNGFDSYLYSGGAKFQLINPVGDANPPLCSLSDLNTTPPMIDVLLEDNRPSEDVNANNQLDAGEDLNGNSEIDEDTGIFTVNLINVVNMQVPANLNSFIPGAGSLQYTLAAIDSALDAQATVRVTDGAGNITECTAQLMGDLCPLDPNKSAPGTCGCGVADTDSDGDGIADCNDMCVNDPLKVVAGACGCGMTDADTDGDGAADCNEQCDFDPLKLTSGMCGCGVADTDTDGDGVADCNDMCVIDPLKVSAGTCGCGVADTDSDGDGTPDCVQKMVMPEIQASDGTFEEFVRVQWIAIPQAQNYQIYRSESPSQRGDFVAAYPAPIVLDDTTAVPGVQYYYTVVVTVDKGNSTVEVEATDPGFRAEPDRLKTPIHTKFNTFLGQLNLLELISAGSEGFPVSLTVFNLRGEEMISQVITLAASEQIDVNINELIMEACDTTPAVCRDFEDLDDNGVIDTYGLLRLEFEDQNPNKRLLGRISHYRRDPGLDSFSMAFARELRNPSNGASYATANTYDPQGQGYLVPNWAEVINLDPEFSKGFTYNLYRQDGSLAFQEHINLPPLGESDVQAGHEIVDANNLVVQAAYLVEILPDDPKSDYLLFIGRYSSNSKEGSGAKTYNYAFALDGRAGAQTSQFVSISNDDHTNDCAILSNWVEVANTSLDQTVATVIFRDEAGIEIDRHTESLAPKSQMHLYATGLLGSAARGSVEVASNVAGRIIAQSLVYYHNCDKNEIQTAYVLPARETTQQRELAGTVNSYLGMENRLQTINTAAAQNKLDLSVKPFGEAVSVGLIDSGAFGSSDIAITDSSSFNLPTDRNGLVMLESSNAAETVGHVLRVRRSIQDGRQRVDFIMPTVLR